MGLLSAVEQLVILIKLLSCNIFNCISVIGVLLYYVLFTVLFIVLLLCIMHINSKGRYTTPWFTANPYLPNPYSRYVLAIIMLIKVISCMMFTYIITARITWKVGRKPRYSAIPDLLHIFLFSQNLQ